MTSTKDGRKIGPKPATKDRLRRKKPIQIEHQVVEDNAYAETLAKAREAMEKAEAKWKEKVALLDAMKGPERTRIAKEAEEARGAYESLTEEFERAQSEAAEHTYSMFFKGIGAHNLDLLSRKHRPTDEDREQWTAEGMDEDEIKQQNRSPSTFPPALISASLTEPKLTEDEVRELIWGSDNFNEAERMAVLMAATRAQGSIARVDLGPTFGAPRSASNSNGSRTTSENPAPSS